MLTCMLVSGLHFFAVFLIVLTVYLRFVKTIEGLWFLGWVGGGALTFIGPT